METIVFNVAGQDITPSMVLGAIALILFLSGAGLFILTNRAGKNLVRAEAELANLHTRMAERDETIARQQEQAEHLRKRNEERGRQIASLGARLEEQGKQNEYIQTQMENRFRLLAGDILKSHGETFSRQNREQVENLLKPLREKIGEFQKQSHEGAARLAEQIGQLTQNSLRMSKEATDLTRALKGSSQTQGAWGEMILDSILARSGLVKGEQYLTQQNHQTGDGRVRTDVEILFPNGDRMVVDSKVSLVDFEGYCNCQDEARRKKLLDKHVRSVQSHVKTLSDKNYHVHAGGGPDFVMMFIPIEAAFSAAFSADSSLIDYAMKRNVYITTPTTLMVALRTVRNVWDIEARNRNAEEIASRAGELYNKVAGFLNNMDKLDKSLGVARKSFDDARNQLVSGRGSVVRQVKLLQKLGAKNSKEIPPGWQEETDGPPCSVLPESSPGTDNSDHENSDDTLHALKEEQVPKFLGVVSRPDRKRKK